MKTSKTSSFTFTFYFLAFAHQPWKTDDYFKAHLLVNSLWRLN